MPNRKGTEGAPAIPPDADPIFEHHLNYIFPSPVYRLGLPENFCPPEYAEEIVKIVLNQLDDAVPVESHDHRSDQE